jgi:hypothetical protein
MIVTITTDSPNIVFGNNQQRINVVVDLKKDGIDGKSAYEIAVENGFVGTEIEFAQSLLDISYIDLTLNYNISKL